MYHNVYHTNTLEFYHTVNQSAVVRYGRGVEKNRFELSEAGIYFLLRRGRILMTIFDFAWNFHK